MRPLEARWAQVRDSILTILHPHPSIVVSTEAAKRRSGETRNSDSPASVPSTLYPSNTAAETLLAAWFDELASIRILDPACGSGNFLYLALRRLLDLWNEARTFAIEHNIQLAIHYAIQKMVSPQQLFGIETEFYAHELASIVVWIGFLQWKREHGIIDDPIPILQRLSNIEHDDAILRYDAEGKPYEPQWPVADFIIGNPPFLGGNKLRGELGDRYVEDLFVTYRGRVPAFADLVCYWFEKGRAEIVAHRGARAGLLATQGIRGGVNRMVLDHIVRDAEIFYAWSDRPWMLDGANVRISMIAFSAPSEGPKELNKQQVAIIHADLSNTVNTRTSVALAENAGLCFMGPSPKAAFDIDHDLARKLLSAPTNVNGRPNSDVVRPLVSAIDLVRRHRDMWTIDFSDLPLTAAAMYELPFEFVKSYVKPRREKASRAEYAHKWWQYGRPRVEMRAALLGKDRFIATPAVAKHPIFVWLVPPTLSNQGTLVFARDDDYFFGILTSVIHRHWALHMGTALEDRPRYTPTTSFETFPFPWPPGTEPSEAESPIVRAIAEAARTLVRLRDAWLNPPGISEEDIKFRTLTKLYNDLQAGKATWLANAHRTLDEAVFAAYGWPSNLTTQQILANLLALNHQRAAAQSASTPKPARPRRAPKPAGNLPPAQPPSRQSK